MKRYITCAMVVISVLIALGCMTGPERETKKEETPKRWWQARATEKPSAGISRENYDRVKRGMTRKEVNEILGEGKEDARGQGVVVVTWQEEGLFPTIITIMFVDGRVDTKAISD